MVRVVAAADGPFEPRILPSEAFQPKVDHGCVRIAVLIGWLALPVWVRERMWTA